MRVNTYIILLRAVNVSGKNSIKMSELVKALEGKGFESVMTYIQSGNIILKSNLDTSEIKNDIEKLIEQHFGLAIHVFVLDFNDIDHILINNPFNTNQEGNRVFITLMNQIPQKEVIEKFKHIEFGDEEYLIDSNVIYFYLPNGMANAKLGNPFIENKLKVIATGRNLNTISKLHEMALNSKN